MLSVFLSFIRNSSAKIGFFLQTAKQKADISMKYAAVYILSA
jgi:hypothetical protein